MLSEKAIKRWYWLHKWSSLICTIFLLMLCITGLPLIFHDEIDQLTRAPEMADIDINDQASLAGMVTQARKEQPDWEIMFLTWDAEQPIVRAVLGSSMQATESDVAIIPFDSRNGERLLAPPDNEGIMYLLLEIHGSMLMGLPGTLFLGLMGLLFVLSLISGVVVYAPFMRRLKFGTIRRGNSKRIKWLDIHNMVGIVTLSWVMVVGFTGVILTLVTPITAIWQGGQLAALTAPYEGIESTFEPVSPDIAIASVHQQIPNADISFVSWPGSPYATPYHYTVAVRGNTPLTRYLLKIAMVDAKSGEITNIENTPWYLSAVNLSVPLHFGDYGGLPLKIIWASLDIAAILVLGSGLYLWWGRRKQGVEKRLQGSQELESSEATA